MTRTHNDNVTRRGADNLKVGDVVSIAAVDEHQLDIVPGDHSLAEVINTEHETSPPSVIVTFDTLLGIIDAYYDEDNCPTFLITN